jgi:two-component system, OmpR family, response regulator PrrA
MAQLLVIHEDADSRSTLIRLLTDAGYAVRSAPQLGDAVRQLLADPPDVVIVGLDPREPGSLEVLQSVREACSAPVLVASPRGDEAGVTRLFRGGADGVVPRPFRGPLLLARVAALLRRSRRPTTTPSCSAGSGWNPDAAWPHSTGGCCA